MAFINSCEHEYSQANDENAGCCPLNPVSQYYTIIEAKKRADFVCVFVHSGVEHFQYPIVRMKSNYSFFIDSGDDAVINSHQHCYIGYEYYKEKPIVYGLGNLLFDNGMIDKKWNISYLAKVTLGEKMF